MQGDYFFYHLYSSDSQKNIGGNRQAIILICFGDVKILLSGSLFVPFYFILLSQKIALLGNNAKQKETPKVSLKETPE